jgi:hypothetical protein
MVPGMLCSSLHFLMLPAANKPTPVRIPASPIPASTNPGIPKVAAFRIVNAIASIPHFQTNQ